MSINWSKLESRGFRKKLIDEVRGIVIRANVGELNIEDISNKTKDNPEYILKLIVILEEHGLVKEQIRYGCPICEKYYNEEEAKDGMCINCVNENDEHPKLDKEKYFERLGPQSRDVRWIVFLHGINTRGAWQEMLQWHLGTTFNHSVPVFIYKYGLIRLRAVVSVSQKKLVKDLYGKLLAAQKAASIKGFGGKPDIIAHSFGTWLIEHLLREYKTFKVGRIILTGSILKPDFEWQKMI